MQVARTKALREPSLLVSNPQNLTHSPMNILAQDVEITGTIPFRDSLTIEGKIDGEITAPGDLTIGETAVVKGDISTRSAIILGKVEGTITVQER